MRLLALTTLSASLILTVFVISAPQALRSVMAAPLREDPKLEGKRLSISERREILLSVPKERRPRVEDALWLTVDLVDFAEELAGMDDVELARAARRCVEELISDDRYENAYKASEKLRIIGPRAIPYLREALHSSDRQQHMYVVSLLIELGDEVDLELLAEAYANLDGDEFVSMHLHDDSDAVRLLIDSGSKAWEIARPGLFSTDPQRRYLSALILAHTRCPRDVTLVVTILAGHLADNRWKGDAGQASRALFVLGEPAAAVLRRLRGMGGLQSRRLVTLLLSEIENPSSDPDEAYERALRLAPGPDGRRPLSVWRFQEDHFFGLEIDHWRFE